MAPCKINPKCNSPNCPNYNKKPKRKEEPDSINNTNPSWNFNRCDNEGDWSFTQSALNKEFWSKVLPKLKDYEKQYWRDITGKNNHFVKVKDLNTCAKKRLDDLNISEEEIYSLRIEGKIRIYGLRPKSTLIILWYDNNHGDNNTCVCRSTKKHS